MADRFDDGESHYGVMYESSESRYATELVNSGAIVVESAAITVPFIGGAFDRCGYVDGGSIIYMTINGKKHCVAMQYGQANDWMCGSVVYDAAGSKIAVKSVKAAADKDTFVVEFDAEIPAGAAFSAVGRFNSEADLLGKHLGEVELQVRDYHFRPRPVSLGVTWTQLSELVLDSSFGVSAEEMLMDFAAQEIKKTLDFQAVKMADAAQKMSAADNFTVFDAAAGDHTKDSYYHTAQLIGQAINRIGDLQLNKINRGGVSAIVGGPAAVEYLKLSQVWKDTGRQASIGGHKCGEYDGKIWNAIGKVA